MGRPSTGARTVYNTIRLDLKYLHTLGLVKKGMAISGTLNWSIDGRSIASIGVLVSYLGGEDNYVLLTYTTTRDNEEPILNCYKVRLIVKESNLGKGELLFFECPESGRLCRFLYLAGRSYTFKHRECYTKNGRRLYYDCQIASHRWRYNDSYWRIDDHLERIGNYRREYAGNKTRSFNRVEFLQHKQHQADLKRWGMAAMHLPGFLNGYNFKHNPG